jgi:hypothetical protein
VLRQCVGYASGEASPALYLQVLPHRIEARTAGLSIILMTTWGRSGIKRLLFAERERLEQQLRDRIEIASRGAAELSFTGPLTLPPEVGRAIVQAVPRTWAQVVIDKKGVLKIPGSTTVEKIIPSATADRQPFQWRFSLFWKRVTV